MLSFVCQLPGRSELYNSWSLWKSTPWSYARCDLCVQMPLSCMLLCFLLGEPLLTFWENTLFSCTVIYYLCPAIVEWQCPLISFQCHRFLLDKNFNNISFQPCVPGGTVKHNSFLCRTHSPNCFLFIPPPNHVFPMVPLRHDLENAYSFLMFPIPLVARILSSLKFLWNVLHI